MPTIVRNERSRRPAFGEKHVGRGYAASCRKAPSSFHRTLAAGFLIADCGFADCERRTANAERRTSNEDRKTSNVSVSSYAAHDPLRYSVNATSTFDRSAAATASHVFSERTSVFHEWRCFGLWKSLFAMYG